MSFDGGRSYDIIYKDIVRGFGAFFKIFRI